jgi:hypothetical protein
MVFLTLPELPVTVIVDVPVGARGPLEQPATTKSTSIAAPRPNRVRKRRVNGKMSRRTIARSAGTTRRIEIGGIASGPGRVIHPFVAIVTVAVATATPSVDVTEAGEIVQVEFIGWPEHAKLTA